MKKIITGFLITLIMIGCTGCGIHLTSELENGKPGKTETREMVQSWYDHVEESVSLEEVQDYFASEISGEENENLYNQVKETGKIDVTSTKIIDSQENQDTVLFNYTIKETGDESWGLILYRRNEELGYVAYQNEDVLQTIINNHLCENCGGSGQVLSANSVTCSICGGTGQQYIPNLYYDTVMGWTGGYTGCGGCGCSGYISGGYTSCSLCGGYGIL